MSAELFQLKNQRIVDANGNTIDSSLTFYLAGTTTLADIYTDDTLTTKHSNPLAVAAEVEVPNIYLDGGIAYRLVIKDSVGSTLQDIDPYAIPASIGVGFKQPSSSAAHRTVRDKLRELVTVFDYGVVGDGVTDDTASGAGVRYHPWPTAKSLRSFPRSSS